MPGFQDYAVAAKARDVLGALVEAEIGRQRPRIQYATVATIDRPNRKCTVTFPGDPAPVTVNMGTIQPAAIGNVVRIDGPVGDRFITEVLGGNAYMGGTTFAGTVTGAYDFNGVTINGTAGRNRFKDSERSDGNGLRVGAAWNKYGIYAEVGDVVVGAASGVVRFQDSQHYFDQNGLTVDNRCYIGRSGAHGTGWAQFSHSAYWNSSLHYGLMHNGGSVLLSGDEVILRYQNANRLCAAGGDVWLGVPLNMRGNTIWLKAYNDDTHRIKHSAGDDGFEYSSWNYHRYWLRGAEVARLQFHDGWYIYQGGWCRTHGDSGHYNNDRGVGVSFENSKINNYPDGAVFEAYRFDQIGNWDINPLWTSSSGGGSGARITFRAAGQNAAPMLKSWFAAIELRNWADSGFDTFRAILENHCRANSKSNIREAKARLTKEDRKRKMKNLRTVHFNRVGLGQGCSSCFGTGLAVNNQRIKDELGKKNKTRPREHKDVDVYPQFENLRPAKPGEPCPDCNGKGKDFQFEDMKKSDEAGWFGFVAEEIEPEFPEAMFYRKDEDGVVRPSGVDHMALIAILWEDNKDQQDEIDALTARLEALEKKGK